MDKLVQWQKLEKKVARYYPQGQNGPPPYPLPAMLPVHFMQLFYNLSSIHGTLRNPSLIEKTH